MSASAQTSPQMDAVAEKAAGSSFYAAMRLMPRVQRDAMFAIYAFCRAVDDIADDAMRGSREERAAELNVWRADLDALYQGGAASHAAFLGPAIRQYGLRKADFLTVIDGMQMDVDTDIRGPDAATLDLYCERVASAVGRLSIKVFGMDEEPGFDLAHHLGRALQLTNIIRDLDEDAQIGRLYLPSELLDAAGIATREPGAVIASPAIDDVCRNIAALAHEHYEEAMRILSVRPRGSLRAPRLMAAVYSRILSKMESQGWAPPRSRAKLGKAQLLWIVARHGLAG